MGWEGSGWRGEKKNGWDRKWIEVVERKVKGWVEDPLHGS